MDGFDALHMRHRLGQLLDAVAALFKDDDLVISVYAFQQGFVVRNRAVDDDDLFRRIIYRLCFRVVLIGAVNDGGSQLVAVAIIRIGFMRAVCSLVGRCRMFVFGVIYGCGDSGIEGDALFELHQHGTEPVLISPLRFCALRVGRG